MTIDIKITGLNLHFGKTSGTVKPLAFADVAMPDLGLTIEGVMLGACDGKVVARPPSAKLTARPERHAVSWGYTSPIGDALRDAILPVFLALGGELPAKLAPPDPEETAGVRRVARMVRHAGDDESAGVRRVIGSDYLAEMKRAGLD